MALLCLLALVGFVAVVALAVAGAAWVLDALDADARARRLESTVHANAIEAASRINAAAYQAEREMVREARGWQNHA